MNPPIKNCRTDKIREINIAAPPANESEVDDSLIISDRVITKTAINKEIIRNRKFLPFECPVKRPVSGFLRLLRNCLAFIFRRIKQTIIVAMNPVISGKKAK